MVKVMNVQTREGKNGSFVVLELEGDLQIQQSRTTGKMYASVSKCTLPCTFEENTARMLIGKTMPGSIVKEPCDLYEYTNPKTGEVLILDYQYTYKATEATEALIQSPFKKVDELEVI